MDTRKKIESVLKEKLVPTFLEVLDESALHAGHPGVVAKGGGHFTVNIVAEAFEGKTLIEQHRLVYEAIGPEMEKEIHALALKTFSPRQWKKS